MQLLDLHSHSGRTSIPIAINVIVERTHRDLLSVIFSVSGAIDQVLWPEPAEPGFSDGLWEHTCFEIFVRSEHAKEYRELNLSPSGRSAAYAFDNYRAGMRRAADVDIAAQSNRVHGDRLQLSAGAFLFHASRAPIWACGFSAVVEARNGEKSYWALAHPPGEPDFHHPDCFAARLAAPDAP